MAGYARYIAPMFGAEGNYDVGKIDEGIYGVLGEMDRQLEGGGLAGWG